MPPKKRPATSKKTAKNKPPKPKTTRASRKQSPKSKSPSKKVSTRQAATPVQRKKAASSPRQQQTKARRSQRFEYDVCLSFAGEDRAYVSRVAKSLTTNGVRVFYDRYEQASLWGKDLYTHLARIIHKNSGFLT